MEEEMNYLVTPAVKEALCQELRPLGKRVISIGDSLLDLGMLEAADLGVLAVGRKRDPRLIRYFSENSGSSIRQFSFNLEKYEQLKEVDHLW